MKRLFFGVSLWACLSASASPLSTTGRNGASEFYLRFGLRIYSGLLKLCLESNQCSAGNAELLKKLAAAPEFHSASLVFRSSRELGNHLYQLQPGGVIEINRDLLYLARNGGLEPWSYPDALDFLGHVWARYLGWSSSDDNFVAGRITDFGMGFAERTAHPEARLNQFAFALFRQPVSSLVVDDTSMNEQSVTLEIPFQSKLSCGPSTGLQTSLHALRVVSARWLPNSISHDSAILCLGGTLEYKCSDKAGHLMRFTSNYYVELDAAFKSNQWVLNPASVRIVQNGIQALVSEHN